MNLAEDKPTKDLVVANPTSILYDSCIIKKDQVRFLTYMYESKFQQLVRVYMYAGHHYKFNIHPPPPSPTPSI